MTTPTTEQQREHMRRALLDSGLTEAAADERVNRVFPATPRRVVEWRGTPEELKQMIAMLRGEQE